MSNMYEETKTWNPFKGCKFDCSYCKPTFQRQAKRIGDVCGDCYNFTPHFHEHRLKTVPSADIIFVAGNGDISFCPTDQVMKIIDRIKDHNKRCDYKTYYFQSKSPKTFDRFKDELPDNCILLTTLETDIQEFKDGSSYSDYSKAPPPPARGKAFMGVDYPRKVLTIEPVMEFSPMFANWLTEFDMEYVWIGYNSKPKEVTLPEPDEDSLQDLISVLVKNDVEVRGKSLRSCEIPSV